MKSKLKLTCAILAAATLAWPVASTWAQNPQDSVQDFRLEPGEPTAPSNIQGPVDAGVPIRVPTPEPAPPTAPPTIAVPTPTPTAEPATAAPTARPSPERTPTPAQQEPVSTSGTDAPAVPAPDEAPAATTQPTAEPDFAPSIPTVEPAPPSAAAKPATADEGPAVPIWIWLVALVVALLAGAAWFLLRRKEPQPPVLLEPAPRPAPRPEQTPTPAPVSETPVPAATPAPAPTAPGLHLQLTPNRLSASLFMATLQYRIELENTGPESLGPIAITGDMIAAHASRSPQEQLAAAGQDLAEMHRVEELHPGEKTELTGEIRVPLSTITPIRQGRALLFVPLVRVYATNASVGSVIGGGTFLIGEPPTAPGGRLRPFRLDLGPRVYPAVEQRKLSVPDAMPLDGRAMAG